MKNKKIHKNILIKLLKKVKQNKKYNSISDEIVLDEIQKYLNENLEIGPITSINKQTISEIRKQLHFSYSSFQTKKKRKISKYLEELKQAKTKKQILEITNPLLSTTLSTKERINSYLEIYKKIFNITNKPKIITDLGAGFNIFSFPYMNLDKLTYYSYDIDKEDIKLINQYLDILNNNLSGKAAILNLRNLKEISSLPSSDIIFLFKTIDILDKPNKNHKSSEGLIKYLLENKTDYIVASFATKTITRKKMNFPTRKWFELMLKRNNLKFQTIRTDNEIFYVVSKH